MKKSSFITMILGTISCIFFALGMCFCMVWNHMIPGIIIGLVGIIILMCLIPLCKGLK